MTSDEEGIEVWGTRRRARMAPRILLVVGALLLCASASRITLNVLEWRSSDQRARELAPDESYSLADRVNAVVTLQRGSRCSIGALRRLAERNDEIGQHARNALLAIANALNEPLSDLPDVSARAGK